MNKHYQSPELFLYRLSEITTGDGVITPSTDILPYNYFNYMQEDDYAAEYGDDA